VSLELSLNGSCIVTVTFIEPSKTTSLGGPDIYHMYCIGTLTRYSRI